ncbi:8-oxoguanine DNA glycosylase [Melioribacter sp. Ez-97]|uniref:8-oxoguanine DNA glycosylase n=1 Tax=Melioribacter sp. Ez-97 TaxID=3423434 RepID=UPI003ED991FE
MLEVIDNTIEYICSELEIKVRPKYWNSMSDEDLMFELVLSILGSQVDFETAYYAARKLRIKNLLNNPTELFSKNEYEYFIRKSLSEPISHESFNHTLKYRFYISKANYISVSIWNIFNKWGNLKRMLNVGYDAKELRKKLIEIVKGFGPKQSSHFLRNIGYTNDFAVLDRHIIDYMRLRGVIKNNKIHISNLSTYETFEKLFIDSVKHFEHSLSILDQAIWIVMRVYKKDRFS